MHTPTRHTKNPTYPTADRESAKKMNAPAITMSCFATATMERLRLEETLINVSSTSTRPTASTPHTTINRAMPTDLSPFKLAAYVFHFENSKAKKNGTREAAEMGDT